MADLTDFQREAVELISGTENLPTAVLQYHHKDGPQILMQNGWADPDDPAPQYDLLAAYVAHLEEVSGLTREEIYDHVESRLIDWNAGDVELEREQRGTE